jgi:Tol biopolymer transport system component
MRIAGIGVLLVAAAAAQDPAKEGQSPADRLPAHITRITEFGERADWSHDGSRILFLEKTFGDVYEIELATRRIRLMTGHYYHEGYTRALYLANGDILLSGAKEFDTNDPMKSRSSEAELWVLDKSLTKPPARLGEKCSEGPAVSRKNLRIAWTVDHEDYPDRMPEGVSQIWMADIVYENDAPRLVNKRLLIDNSAIPHPCSLETQNFVPPSEKRLTFSAYRWPKGTDVMVLDLSTGTVEALTNSPDEYDEPEGMFPDGKHTLVECDRHNHKGDKYIDIWRLGIVDPTHYERLTFFSEYPGYKASNPVVSDDGRFMAFQLGMSRDMAGVGHGIFVYDFEAANQ